MSLDTVKGIAALLRAAREPGAADDPTYFDRKAAAFEAIAAEDPSVAADAARFAAVARETAQRLRTLIAAGDG